MYKDRQEQLSWSLIDPKPTFYFHKTSNSHICYWQGVAMTRNQALLILQSQWNQAWPSQQLKNIEWSNFKRAYAMGAFGKVHWDLSTFTSSTHFASLVKWIEKDNTNFIKQLGENYTMQQALSWLLDENELND